MERPVCHQRSTGVAKQEAEFLIFMLEGKEDGIQVMYHNETIWCTQKAMSTLFDCSTDNIGLHLKNIFTSGELRKDSTTEFFSVVQIEGGRQVSRKTLFYNLDAIISVGYRVNSVRATQFRQWCTSVIRQFAIRGYVIDKKRMENGSFIGEDYFEHLLAEIRISMLPLLTIIVTHQPPASFSKRYKIRYIMPYTVIPPPS